MANVSVDEAQHRHNARIASLGFIESYILGILCDIQYGIDALSNLDGSEWRIVLQSPSYPQYYWRPHGHRLPQVRPHLDLSFDAPRTAREAWKHVSMLVDVGEVAQDGEFALRSRLPALIWLY